VSTNGTDSPSATLKVAMCARSRPVNWTGVRSQTASGPAVALMPPLIWVSQGTMEP
jgi:hypothetical protein